MASLASVVDRWYAIRADRLAKEKEAKALLAQEEQLEQWLLSNGGKRAIIGKACRVQIGDYVHGEISDFDALAAFIAAHKRLGSFDLLYHRLNNKTYLEWASQGREVDGVTEKTEKKLYLRSL